MILLSLFIALVLERLRITPAGWQMDNGARKFDAWLAEHETFQAARQHETFGPLVLLVPALLLAILLLFDVGGLVVFFANIAVLTLAFGCRSYRDALKRWYLATKRDDQDAQQEAAAFLLQGNEAISLGQQLAWLNFRYYFSVIFWFVLFGAPGVLGYALLRANEQRLPRLMFWIDWLPVRMAGLAYLFVGQFTSAAPVWLASIGKVAPSQAVLIELAVAAEHVEQNDDDESKEPQALLGLARRASVLLLVAIALASLLGWIL